MKRIWLFILSVLIISSWYTLAQSSTQTTDIKEIKARYCNESNTTDTKRLFIEAEPNVPSEICINFINTSNQEAHIGINFVDGTITNDSSQNKACLPEGEKNLFWQYVLDYPKQITIAPNNTTQVKATLLFWAGYAGTSYGCLTYHALDNIGEENIVDNGSMFKIFSRVGSFIDAFVDGEFIINLVPQAIENSRYNNRTNNPNLIIYRVSDNRSDFFKRDFWTYRIKWNIKNTGNIGTNSQINFSLTDRFIIPKTRLLSDQVITPNQIRTFETSIPRYMARGFWGPFKVKATLDYKAIYLGSDASKAPQEIYSLSDTTYTFFFPYGLIIIGGGYGLYTLYRKKYNNRKIRKSTKK